MYGCSFFQKFRPILEFNAAMRVAQSFSVHTGKPFLHTPAEIKLRKVAKRLDVLFEDGNKFTFSAEVSGALSLVCMYHRESHSFSCMDLTCMHDLNREVMHACLYSQTCMLDLLVLIPVPQGEESISRQREDRIWWQSSRHIRAEACRHYGSRASWILRTTVRWRWLQSIDWWRNNLVISEMIHGVWSKALI